MHNSEHPAGAMRAQVGVLTDGSYVGTVQLDPTADGSATGSIALTLDPTTGETCYEFGVDTTTSTAITAAHIHTGAEGVNGGVLINLDYDANMNMGCVTVSAIDVETVIADPAGHYVNVHTVDALPGAMRGQVDIAAIKTASGTLDGNGFGDPDGSGTAALTMYPNGNVCFELTTADIAEASAAHVHTGNDGELGSVLINLDIAVNGLTGCVASTVTDVAAVLADPAGHYVNVHNADYPGWRNSWSAHDADRRYRNHKT